MDVQKLREAMTTVGEFLQLIDEAESEVEGESQSEETDDIGEDAQPATEDAQETEERDWEEEFTILSAIAKHHNIDVDAAMENIAWNRNGEVVYVPPADEAPATGAEAIAQKLAQNAPRRNVGTKQAHSGKADVDNMSLQEKAQYYRNTVKPATEAGKPI